MKPLNLRAPALKGRNLMALTKRDKYWHYDFWYKGQRYQGSTDQTNINQARLVVAAVRSNAALAVFGIAPPKLAPMFKDFMENRFLSHVREHNAKKPATVAFYEEKTLRLLEHLPFARARLTEIDEDMISKYKTERSAQKVRGRNSDTLISPTSVNRELATLGKALNLAFEWRLIPRAPKIRRLPGEAARDFVLTGDMEKLYLAKADHPLRQIAVLMLDLGLRPEECVRIRKADVTDGAVTVRHGKTKNAARSLPQTQRTRAVFELLGALWPDSEWFFPGHKKGTHLLRSSIDNMHQKIRNAEDSGFPKEFVLYSCRHTFGTRLAESGAGPFEIKSAMGHSDIRVSQKYVHPSASHMELALKRKEAFDRLLRGESAVPAISGDRDKISS